MKPSAVIEAMSDAMRSSYANVHRGLHTLANETTEAFEEARENVARFINAPAPESIVFTKGGTEAINLVAASLGVSLQPGDEIVLSAMEHHSNIVPWHFLRERKGAVLHWMDTDDDGGMELDVLDVLISAEDAARGDDAIVECAGREDACAEIIEIAHARGAPVLIDGCQAVVHDAVDVQDLDVDFYVFSGHKLYGPTGIGVLYGKPERLAALPPYQGGGEMIGRCGSTASPTPSRRTASRPARRRSWRPSASARRSTGLEWLDRAAVARARARAARPRDGTLRRMNGCGSMARRRARAPSCRSICGAHAHDVAQILDRMAWRCARAHCAEPLMRRLGVTSSARATFALYNTIEEVDAFVDALLAHENCFCDRVTTWTAMSAPTPDTKPDEAELDADHRRI